MHKSFEMCTSKISTELNTLQESCRFIRVFTFVRLYVALLHDKKPYKHGLAETRLERGGGLWRAPDTAVALRRNKTVWD